MDSLSLPQGLPGLCLKARGWSDETLAWPQITSSMQAPFEFPDFKVGWGGGCETARESLVVLADGLPLNALTQP